MEIHVQHAHGSTGLDNLAFDKSSRIDNRIKTSPYEYEYKVGILQSSRYPEIPSTLCLAIE